ncbi:alanine or glycine:cation symporter, AGCS family [Ruminococcus sp. YRD2003]|uniref:alanine/glycine:cation symporter family protein n=1 Tax=Ruminococcus sp. YRD2003 TaxID=1452313 RepID=UPI0008AD2AA6|nr:alanine or glycine:cation symporter, AGCS family [Ruminococcus flavefaciens]
MDKINDFISVADSYVWGLPLIILIMVCGVLLTARLKLLQVRRLGTALKYMVKNEENGSGEVSSFAALCTALSATVGTGNIVGVATAIAAGGPGALFWMELAAFLGMATKYAEGLLAVKYRVKDENGNYLGGPFYYIENGLGKKWKWLGKIFAVFGLLAGIMGIGTITQINGITSAANTFFDPDMKHTVTLFGMDYTWTTVIAGALITLLTALIVIGGIKRIATVSEVIVPVMIVAYAGCCLTIIFCHITEIPSALSAIIEGAFSTKAVAGGTAGTVMMYAMKSGVARGIFSNEAGLGSAPIAAAAAKTNEPVRQGLVTMTGTFIDTIIVCTMTGLAIIMSGSHNTAELKGVMITMDAFDYGLPFSERVSSFILMSCLAVFAFTTILGWNYYSERRLSYLTGANKYVAGIYRWVYIAAVFIGPYLAVEAVWNLADIFNGLMAIPNVVAIILLSGVVSSETKDYIARLKAGKVEE